jgi:transcriptional regulator with XRE-family HTH domain
MLTQGELAAIAGLSVYTVHAAEHGRNVSPKTGRALATALGVGPSELLPKEQAPLSPQPSLLNGVLEEERRAAERLATSWKDYVSLRIDWCWQVTDRTAEETWNNPFLSLDSAIQWALYIGIEHAYLKRIVYNEVIPHVGSPEAAQELQALVDSFADLSRRTDERVSAMIEAAELDEEEKEQTKLRLIHGGKKSA